MVLDEFNVFKIIVLINFGVIATTLLAISIIDPFKTGLISVYSWFWVIIGVLISLSVVIPDRGVASLFKTITFEVSEFHPAYWLDVAPSIVFWGSVFLGLVWGGFYSYSVITTGRAFISVPNLFSVAPSPFEQALDLFSTSWLVSTIEEMLWSGILMPLLWGLIFLIVSRFSREQTVSLLVSLLLASAATGWIVAYPIHDFAYQGNLYAKANSFWHFAGASLVAGGTGTVIAPIIAHAMHNFTVKFFQIRGTFQVVPSTYSVVPSG